MQTKIHQNSITLLNVQRLSIEGLRYWETGGGKESKVRSQSLTYETEMRGLICEHEGLTAVMSTEPRFESNSSCRYDLADLMVWRLQERSELRPPAHIETCFRGPMQRSCNMHMYSYTDLALSYQI